MSKALQQGSSLQRNVKAGAHRIRQDFIVAAGTRETEMITLDCEKAVHSASNSPTMRDGGAMQQTDAIPKAEILARSTPILKGQGFPPRFSKS
jgi:hypothetical protein